MGFSLPWVKKVKGKVNIPKFDIPYGKG